MEVYRDFSHCGRCCEAHRFCCDLFCTALLICCWQKHIRKHRNLCPETKEKVQETQGFLHFLNILKNAN